MKKYILITAALISFSSFCFGQLPEGKSFSWKKFGCALAMNGIQGQVEIPLMTSVGSISTGAGAVLVDADGNIIAKGTRVDHSFSFSIIPKYYINENFLLRFEFGMTGLSLKANPDLKSATDHEIASENVNTKIFRYSPGFQWIFMKRKKIESYCGMTISYVNYTNINIDVYSESRELVTDTVQSWLRKNEITPGGFALGIGSFAGFSIYLNKNISLGAELASSAMYYKLGGETIGENSEQVPPNPIYYYKTSFANSYEGFRISKIISSFNISIWL